MPWQRHVVDVALELDPDTGELFYSEVIVTVPRQSGKTTLVLALFAWRCVVLSRRAGAQTCTYIAQSGKMARRKLEREFARILRGAKNMREIPQESRAKPHRGNEWKLSMNNNGEHIAFGTGSFLQIDPPTEDASHGDVLDMPVIDEAFAHRDDLVEQAVDAATITRWSQQTYVVSTVGNEHSTFLAGKVLAGRKAVEGAGSRSAYFEWSLAEDEDYTDPAVWWRRLPALGHTITEQKLAARLDKAQRGEDGEETEAEDFGSGVDGFRRGYMNTWVRWPPTGSSGFLPADIWADLAVKDPKLTSVCFGISVALDGSYAAVASAGRLPDGSLYVDSVKYEPGTDWLVDDVIGRCENKKTEQRVNPGAVEGSFIRKWTEAGVDIGEVSGREYQQACGEVLDGIKNRALHHLGQPALDRAVRAAQRRDVGKEGGWVWAEPLSGVDLSPLKAATLALSGVTEQRKPRIHTYDPNYKREEVG